MFDRKLFTLVLITENDQMLLGMKKRGFGVGKWNGFGGKVEPGETIEEAARRELYEESSLVCEHLRKIGVLMFHDPDESIIREVHVFGADLYDGIPTESEEMAPKWFKVSRIPFEEMFDSDKIWLPLFFEQKSFSGYFRVDDDGAVLKHVLNTLPNGADIEPLFSAIPDTIAV